MAEHTWIQNNHMDIENLAFSSVLTSRESLAKKPFCIIFFQTPTASGERPELWLQGLGRFFSIHGRRLVHGVGCLLVLAFADISLLYIYSG